MRARLALTVLLLASAPLAAAADVGPVLLAKAKGPKKGVPAAVSKAVAVELERGGVAIAELKAAAKKAKPDLKLAKVIGARFLVTLEVVPEKKRFAVKAEALRVADGSSIFSGKSEPYAGKGDAAQAAGALGKTLASKLKEAAGPDDQVASRGKSAASAAADEEEDGEEEAAKPEPSAAPVVASPPPAAPPKDEPAPAPKEEPAPEPVVASAPREDGSGAHLFELGAAFGTQASSAYTVIVGGAPTALAYTLSPLMLIGAHARFVVPSTALGIEAELAWSPVTFAINTQPPVSPAEPSGSFLAIGGTVGWRFQVTGSGGEGLMIEPLAGFGFESLGVSDHEPRIVLGHSAIVPSFGARFLYGLSSSLTLGVEARLRLPLGYAETGAKTGDGGGGFGIALGGGARWWFLSFLGASIDASYEYSSVSFSGTGDRQRFAGDPELVDASVAASALKVSIGPVVAF